MIEPLLSYFGKIVKNIVLIDAQHPGSDTIVPIIERYHFGKLTNTSTPSFLFPPLFILNRNNTLKTQPSFKIRDFVTTCEVLIKHAGQVDLFIGLESIFTIAGILFKRFGKVKRVVYYVSDYSPTRYSSKLLNSIYLWLDQFCATHADYIWDVSPAMMPARIKYGLDSKKAAPCILVPNALFPWQIAVRPEKEIEPNTLAFAGTIGPENGLDLAIEATNIVQKTFPKIRLHIYGGGLKQDEEKAARLIKKLKLEKNVVHHGFVSDLKKLSAELSKCQIGLAPYRAIPSSVRWYADATKLRLYFANGLPVVSTHVAPLAHETAKKGAVVVTPDTKNEFAEAIIKILKNKEKYKRMRQAAITYAKFNTWTNAYSHAFDQMHML